MQYDNTNSGMLKRNPAKETEDHPDYKGSINANGVEYWVSAWINIAKEGSKIPGQKFLKIKLTPKDAPPQSKKPAAAPSHDDLDDDFPF